ncbi:MAG: rRNA maturation RNase YbeY [Burkholderiaceae bacterium]|nr:MAG: rRNA maturation RNase YbeY [Burkholderiaceae bacterium]
MKQKKSYPLNLSVQFAATLPEGLNRSRIRRWVQAALQQPAQLTLRFVATTEGKKLNATFRGKDYASNVLTFPYHEASDATALADIVICVPVVAREAKEQKKELPHHFAHLIVHGVLHAQGFDHIKKKDAVEMEALEVSILQRLRVPNPYLA